MIPIWQILLGLAVLGKKNSNSSSPPPSDNPGNPGNPVVDDYLDRM